MLLRLSYISYDVISQQSGVGAARPTERSQCLMRSSIDDEIIECRAALSTLHATRYTIFFTRERVTVTAPVTDKLIDCFFRKLRES